MSASTVSWSMLKVVERVHGIVKQQVPIGCTKKSFGDNCEVVRLRCLKDS